jgi:hypothetical protein
VSNRWFRFVIALLAIGAAGAAGYRIYQYELQLASAHVSARAGATAAESALTRTLELQSALHAYVAPGQGHDFWMTRTTTMLDSLRAAIIELDSVATTHGVAVTETLDLSDRLGASEERARRHARAGQSLLAAEIIFTDARDLLESIRTHVARARTEIAAAADRRDTDIRREQALLALGLVAVLTLAILVLVPPGRAAVLANVPPERAASVVSTAPVAPAQGTAPAVPVHRTAPVAPAAPVSPALPSPSLAEAAGVCTDMGRVSQGNEISALLTRAAAVLSASGAIVWVASENRDELFPAASSGYDDRLFDQIGSIRRDEANLTAAAFRDAAARMKAATGSVAAALAVPLLTPHGPIGVFSAEFREISHVDRDRVSLATIFAAQLANLLGSISTTVPTEVAPAEDTDAQSTSVASGQ